jgi:hypothetical protein
MTRILLAWVLCLLSGSSLAQTFACQYIANAGLSWESGQWVVSKFTIREPFFFTIKAGIGITSFKGDKLIEDNLVCDQRATGNGSYSCSTSLGDYLYFREKTLRGTISSNFGGTLDGARRDSVSISPFICTKM